MSKALILQGPWRPTAVLTALEALASYKLDELRVAVAYTTLGGCEELMPRLEERVGAKRWAAIPKAVITSTDFGLTEPRALEYLRDEHGMEVRLSDIPSSFHPKLYGFRVGAKFEMFVGSANLTRAALSSNGEAGVVASLKARGRSGFDLDWAELTSASKPLTASSLADYKKRRRRKPPPIPPETKVVGVGKKGVKGMTPLSKAIVEGVVEPTAFEAFWVEAGSMSSSESHSQLELPRGAHRFFGMSFGEYDDEHHTLGHPRLLLGGRSWTNRPLTWHGNNKMERINLPTAVQGGFPSYKWTAILFKRVKGGFQLSVAPWESKVAASWRAASRRIGQEHRLGRTSPRTCGLF
jgi:HKD family nuclease